MLINFNQFITQSSSKQMKELIQQIITANSIWYFEGITTKKKFIKCAFQKLLKS